MTLGQRICQKRKELGLSQETLGEQLGVSRQAIYKWESDGAVPEVEKLIALSQIFSVSVGWLLGVEDAAPETSEAATELTDTQLAMVKEIVEQYLAAREEARPPRKVWPRVLAGLGAAVLVIVLFRLSGRVDQTQQSNQELQASLFGLQNSISSQVSSIYDRVQTLLQEQNDLTAQYDTQHLSNDLEANTATFSVSAVPKTYQPGMTAVFRAHSGEEIVEVTVAQPDGDNAFAGVLTCPLTDEIILSVVFRAGDTEQTQVLDVYDSLYTETFPNLGALLRHGDAGWQESGEDLILSSNEWTFSRSGVHDTRWKELLEEGTLRVGLFRDGELLLWHAQGKDVADSSNPHFSPPGSPYWYLAQPVTLEPGHVYVSAAVYTDSLGRTLVYPDSCFYRNSASDGWVDGFYSDHPLAGDPQTWTF